MAHLLLRLRKIPLQWALVVLVVGAAAASAVRSSRVHPAATAAGPNPRAAGTLAEQADGGYPQGVSISGPVEDAYEAAKRGDFDGYLNQFAEPLRTQLARTRAEKGDAYLRDYLARLTAPLKGVVIHADRKETIGPDAVRVPVEFVYGDRNEMQSFSLQQDAGRWRICRIDSLRAARTLIPFGTPIERVR